MTGPQLMSTAAHSRRREIVQAELGSPRISLVFFTVGPEQHTDCFCVSSPSYHRPASHRTAICKPLCLRTTDRAHSLERRRRGQFQANARVDVPAAREAKLARANQSRCGVKLARDPRSRGQRWAGSVAIAAHRGRIQRVLKHHLAVRWRELTSCGARLRWGAWRGVVGRKRSLGVARGRRELSPSMLEVRTPPPLSRGPRMPAMLEFWYGRRRTCSFNRSASRVPHALGWIGALSMFFDPNHTNFPAGSVIWLAAPFIPLTT